MKNKLGILLAVTLFLGACATTGDFYTNTTYTDPNTGALVVVVYEEGGGYIKYIDHIQGITTVISFIKDEVSGEITYINPETGIETVVGIRSQQEERG
jgi:hypothetical protein